MADTKLNLAHFDLVATARLSGVVDEAYVSLENRRLYLSAQLLETIRAAKAVEVPHIMKRVVIHNTGLIPLGYEFPFVVLDTRAALRRMLTTGEVDPDVYVQARDVLAVGLHGLFAATTDKGNDVMFYWSPNRGWFHWDGEQWAECKVSDDLYVYCVPTTAVRTKILMRIPKDQQ